MRLTLRSSASGSPNTAAKEPRVISQPYDSTAPKRMVYVDGQGNIVRPRRGIPRIWILCAVAAVAEGKMSTRQIKAVKLKFFKICNAKMPKIGGWVFQVSIFCCVHLPVRAWGNVVSKLRSASTSVDKARVARFLIE